ncbi:MAG: UPF0175 family protein, partial [Desulfobacterales bacterium]|nr:UPF0175 family protein [Desulfobacterales bacterium]
EGILHFASACKLAEMQKIDFHMLLGDRQIPRQYDEEEYEADLKTISQIDDVLWLSVEFRISVSGCSSPKSANVYCILMRFPAKHRIKPHPSPGLSRRCRSLFQTALPFYPPTG